MSKIRRRVFNSMKFLFILSIVLFIRNKSFRNYSNTRQTRAAIVTLIRGTNQSIQSTMNMIHSVMKFYFQYQNISYPFIIFYDENFTILMRECMLSCLKTSYSDIQISFAFVSFRTTIQPNPESYQAKSIGYRLMCRFWIYDIFYHPIIVNNHYNYLMRIDDDSYFFDYLSNDLFEYMNYAQLDYLYRTKYHETVDAMQAIDQYKLNSETCIYNNFFIINLTWYYQSKIVQNFIGKLLKNDLILREYFGDGCIHKIMIDIDKNCRSEQIRDLSYEYIRRSIFIGIGIYLFIWFLIFQSNTSSTTNPTEIDHFLISSICGRLIRIPNLTLTTNEFNQLTYEATNYFNYPRDCTFFERIQTNLSTYSIAFTILIHPNVEQLDYLLRLIYQPSHVFCIHIDLKSSNELYESIVSRSKCVSNIIFPDKRLNVTWGRFSVIEAEYLCQKKLLEYPRKWNYYFNLANSDVPLKTNRELIEILKLYNQQNDVTSLIYRSRLRQHNSIVNKTVPSSIEFPLYKGEFHALLTRETVEFIHTNSRARDLFDYLNGTFVPDEHYYSIINRWKQTPGYYPYNHDLSQITFMTRYKIWADRPEVRLCRGGFIRGICIFNYQDLWHLVTSPHLFANKILFQRDRIAPYCLAKYLDIRQRNDFSIVDDDFYRQLPNVRFGRTRE